MPSRSLDAEAYRIGTSIGLSEAPSPTHSTRAPSAPDTIMMSPAASMSAPSSKNPFSTTLSIWSWPAL